MKISRMKKFLCILSCMLICLSLCSCGNSQKSTEEIAVETYDALNVVYGDLKIYGADLVDLYENFPGKELTIKLLDSFLVPDKNEIIAGYISYCESIKFNKDQVEKIKNDPEKYFKEDTLKDEYVQILQAEKVCCKTLYYAYVEMGTIEKIDKNLELVKKNLSKLSNEDYYEKINEYYTELKEFYDYCVKTPEDFKFADDKFDVFKKRVEPIKSELHYIFK